MDKTQFGVRHLAANVESYNPQRNNNFRFIVTGIDNILKAGADENSDNAYVSNIQHTLDFSVVSTSIPNFSQDAYEIKRGNSSMWFAGRPTFESGSLVVNDYIGINTKSALMAWQRLSYDVKNDVVGNPADYKKLCYLIEYDTDWKVVRTWAMYGCWVSGLQEDNYTNENADGKTITATIRFDWAIPEEV